MAGRATKCLSPPPCLLSGFDPPPFKGGTPRYAIKSGEVPVGGLKTSQPRNRSRNFTLNVKSRSFVVSFVRKNVIGITLNAARKLKKEFSKYFFIERGYFLIQDCFIPLSLCRDIVDIAVKSPSDILTWDNTHVYAMSRSPPFWLLKSMRGFGMRVLDSISTSFKELLRSKGPKPLASQCLDFVSLEGDEISDFTSEISWSSSGGP